MVEGDLAEVAGLSQSGAACSTQAVPVQDGALKQEVLRRFPVPFAEAAVGRGSFLEKETVFVEVVVAGEHPDESTIIITVVTE